MQDIIFPEMWYIVKPNHRLYFPEIAKLFSGKYQDKCISQSVLNCCPEMTGNVCQMVSNCCPVSNCCTEMTGNMCQNVSKF